MEYICEICSKEFEKEQIDNPDMEIICLDCYVKAVAEGVIKKIGEELKK